MKTEAKVDVLKMGIASEDVHNIELLHHDHADEIHEGDVRLVVVFLPELPGTAELLD